MKNREISPLCGSPDLGRSCPIESNPAGPARVVRSTRPQSASAHGGRATRAQDFTPISAATYLSQAVQVSVPASNLDFRVYYTPPAATGPEGEFISPTVSDPMFYCAVIRDCTSMSSRGRLF